jgi:Reverse transcriptase (RNA-dependent DNA polymerase)
MEREIKTLKRMGTWETVLCPEGKNIVGSKWVFQLKCKADGSIDKYKARLITRSFTQIYGVDYFDTFSPVMKLASIRTILTLAARHDWDVDTFDFNSAYLNGELGEEEEIYMQEPPGFEESTGSVKWLRKSLYRLKQARRWWYDTLTCTLNNLGLCVT